jgi:hypothetical protein
MIQNEDKGVDRIAVLSEGETQNQNQKKNLFVLRGIKFYGQSFIILLV